MKTSFIKISGLVFFQSFLISNLAWAMVCDEPPTWLNVREAVFTNSSKELITVKFPDLSQLPCEVEGDWGPNYHFKLDRSNSAVILNKNSGRVIEFIHELEASSVMKASERSETPHFIRLSDREMNINYDIYFHKNKGPSFVVTNDKERYQTPIVSFDRYLKREMHQPEKAVVREPKLF